jgi:hypothetical protein
MFDLRNIDRICTKFSSSANFILIFNARISFDSHWSSIPGHLHGVHCFRILLTWISDLNRTLKPGLYPSAYANPRDHGQRELNLPYAGQNKMQPAADEIDRLGEDAWRTEHLLEELFSWVVAELVRAVASDVTAVATKAKPKYRYTIF